MAIACEPRCGDGLALPRASLEGEEGLNNGTGGYSCLVCVLGRGAIAFLSFGAIAFPIF